MKQLVMLKNITQLKVLGRKPFPFWWNYLFSVGLVGIATLLGALGQSFLTATDIVMLYLLCVVVAAVFSGVGSSILASILGVLAHDFFFVGPYLSFGPPKLQDIPTLIVLLLVGFIISYLTSRIRQHIREAERRAQETSALYALSRNLTTTDKMDTSVRAIMKSIKETMGHDVSLFLPGSWNNGILKKYLSSAEHTSEGEMESATWAFQHQKRAGYGTDTFPDAKVIYMPLMTFRGPVGVMALSLDDMSSPLTAEKERLIEAFTDLAAVAIEHIALAEEARNMKISQAVTEKLQTALLDSVSHDLCTPLSSIIGGLSSLLEAGSGLDDAAKRELMQVAYEEAEELYKSITNLLDVSRIQAGTINISTESCDLNDIISVALDQMSKRLKERNVSVDVPSTLPFVSVDFGLIVKVLVNLLGNAVKYSSPGSPIEVSAREIGREVEVKIADRGVGIPPQHLPYVFERFHLVPHTDIPSTGLGLSICRGFVEAHGGHIVAENRPGGGVIIRMTLPVAEAVSVSDGE